MNKNKVGFYDAVKPGDVIKWCPPGECCDAIGTYYKVYTKCTLEESGSIIQTLGALPIFGKSLEPVVLYLSDADRCQEIIRIESF